MMMGSFLLLVFNAWSAHLDGWICLRDDDLSFCLASFFSFLLWHSLLWGSALLFHGLYSTVLSSPQSCHSLFLSAFALLPFQLFFSAIRLALCFQASACIPFAFFGTAPVMKAWCSRRGDSVSPSPWLTTRSETPTGVRDELSHLSAPEGLGVILRSNGYCLFAPSLPCFFQHLVYFSFLCLFLVSRSASGAVPMMTILCSQVANGTGQPSRKLTTL